MKTKTVIFLTSLLFLFISRTYTQNEGVSINADGSNPDNSAILDVKSSSKGFLPPRMTFSLINAIPSPADGLMVFCTDCGTNGTGALAINVNGLWYYFNPISILPPAPTAGTHVPSQTYITWNWNTNEVATGYKWNTTNNYETAADMVSSTTKVETALTCETNYTRYMWAYNNLGHSGSVTLNQSTLDCFVFNCGDPFTDTRDSKAYTTILIGDQCWMAENLSIGTRIDGNEVQTNNSIIEKYCYDNNNSNCDVYGGLYQWDEMMQYSISSGAQGICPAGWHIPTEDEWNTLNNFVSNKLNWICNNNPTSNAKALASSINWEVSLFSCAVGNNQALNNSSGFAGMPSGFKNYGNAFYNMTNFGWWWSSTQQNLFEAWYRNLTKDNDFFIRGYNVKHFGFSVRCLKD